VAPTRRKDIGNLYIVQNTNSAPIFGLAPIVFLSFTYHSSKQSTYVPVLFQHLAFYQTGPNYVTNPLFEHVEDILASSHLKIFPYYSRCLDRIHKDFLWTGPKVEIFPRSQASNFIVPTSKVGVRLDLPSHEIYLDPTPANSPHDSGDSMDDDDADGS
jgi:hypothetical protein